MSYGTKAYTNEYGQDIYWVTPDATIIHPRPIPNDVRMLVMHDTDAPKPKPGEVPDSRPWLKSNPVPVSSHYLIGMYPDCITASNPKGIQIVKYASEANTETYTEGYGSIGGDPGNPNSFSVSIEVEYTDGTAWDIDLLKAAATLARSIINGWQAKGNRVLVVGHRDIDPAKADPRFEWTGFMEMVYGTQA